MGVQIKIGDHVKIGGANKVASGTGIVIRNEGCQPNGHWHWGVLVWFPKGFMLLQPAELELVAKVPVLHQAPTMELNCYPEPKRSLDFISGDHVEVNYLGDPMNGVRGVVSYQPTVDSEGNPHAGVIVNFKDGQRIIFLPTHLKRVAGPL
jgi:hypothetical protein